MKTNPTQCLTKKNEFGFALFGGDNGIRTRDLCVANATLSQLSYVPATAVYYSAEKAETELEISDFAPPRAQSFAPV